MKAALDVSYEKDRAIAACVVFKDWLDSEPSELIREVGEKPLTYRAGRFYKRELPFLLAVLQRANRRFETIIIDGYVFLRPDVGKGLGLHLFESLSYSPVVVGVAKSPLKIADQFAPIIRGRSQKPLYVSAIGCRLDQAADSIKRMHGPYRIPTLLKLADQYARTA